MLGWMPPPKFQIFGLQHLAVLALLAVLCVLVMLASRKLAPPRRLWLGRALGLLLFSYAVVLYLDELRNGWLQATTSLPMQLCDWVLIACLIALFRNSALASEIAYFWGFGGTLQAVLMPDIAQGFPSWRFVQFFWGHGLTLFCIVYIVTARNFRPRARPVGRMMAALNVYGVFALTIDLAFGWNYGYLLHKPQGASLFDFLGPWPWYLLFLELLGLIIFWLLALPWKILDRHRAHRHETELKIPAPS